tara:strand:+ start:210 stop:482 length:273 start_codon:yes stop_codon:yes gene_type:complete
MPLGNPNQGQQQWALINELVRKDKEREEAEAAAKGFDLGEFMEGAEANVARNAQEWDRREAERRSQRLEGQIEFNQREEADRNAQTNPGY